MFNPVAATDFPALVHTFTPYTDDLLNEDEVLVRLRALADAHGPVCVETDEYGFVKFGVELGPITLLDGGVSVEFGKFRVVWARSSAEPSDGYHFLVEAVTPIYNRATSSSASNRVHPQVARDGGMVINRALLDAYRTAGDVCDFAGIVSIVNQTLRVPDGYYGNAAQWRGSAGRHYCGGGCSRQATAVCTTCAMPVCTDCSVSNRSRRYCNNCVHHCGECGENGYSTTPYSRPPYACNRCATSGGVSAAVAQARRGGDKENYRPLAQIIIDATRERFRRSDADRVAAVSVLVDDLDQIVREFPGGLFVDPRLKFVAAHTDEIVLVQSEGPLTGQEVNLGPFETQYYWQSSDIKIKALRPNPAAGGRRNIHPHVLGDTLCTGVMRTTVSNAAAAGKVIDLMYMLRSILSDHEPDASHRKLQTWHNVPCAKCGQTVSNVTATCGGCHSTYCGNCVVTCQRLGCTESVCGACARACHKCSQRLCRACGVVRRGSANAACPVCVPPAAVRGYRTNVGMLAGLRATAAWVAERVPAGRCDDDFLSSLATEPRHGQVEEVQEVSEEVTAPA